LRWRSWRTRTPERTTLLTWCVRLYAHDEPRMKQPPSPDDAQIPPTTPPPKNVSALLLCAVLFATAQTSAQRRAQAPAAPARRDTVYIVQPPSPIVNVDAPSQWPTVVLGVLGLILVGFQLRIMARQTEILDRQTTIAAREAESRVIEAVGTFIRLAFDLAAEFRKANVLPGVQVMADFKTHPRAMLREASRLFAPLGNAFVVAANQAAMRLDEYFSAVSWYNQDVRGREGAARLEVAQQFRERVGRDLDQANRAIAEAARWRYDNGTESDFRALCSSPPGFLEATSAGEAPSGPDHTDVYRE
jgi:hypothetical protein